MKNANEFTAHVDEQGRLVIPPEIASEFGLKPGSQVRLQQDGNEVHIQRPISHLARVYIEPTSFCNLECRTCMRNNWEEKQGRMEESTFERILEGLKAFSPIPTVFFGGYGEPLFHPQTLAWVRRVKALGGKVEMITNGTMINEKIGLELMRSGLDILWVSLDGARPESYEDVRLGATLPVVIENLRRLRQIRYHLPHHAHVFELGIAFVAMQRNIADLPEVIRLGLELGAKHFSISNVLAHNDFLQRETLYKNTVRSNANSQASALPTINLPRMDINEHTEKALFQVLRGNYRFFLAGRELNRSLDSCPFLEKGATVIRWDGKISACLPLLHTHDSLLADHSRHSLEYSSGNIHQHSLAELWNDPEYINLRQRLQDFSFSPCTYCNPGCDLSHQNEEDCRANPFPTCGGCLWAQGIVLCP